TSTSTTTGTGSNPERDVTDRAEPPPSWASQVQHLDAEPGSTVYAVLDGDMHIRNGRPAYRFERFPHPADLAGPTPTRWSSAELAPGRARPPPGVSVMLRHGPADGVTRLTPRFAADSRSGHWSVWAAQCATDSHPAAALAPAEEPANLLLIVEHA